MQEQNHLKVLEKMQMLKMHNELQQSLNDVPYNGKSASMDIVPWAEFYTAVAINYNKSKNILVSK